MTYRADLPFNTTEETIEALRGVGAKPCHMGFAHTPHSWDTEDRVHLRYVCPGRTVNADAPSSEERCGAVPPKRSVAFTAGATACRRAPGHGDTNHKDGHVFWDGDATNDITSQGDEPANAILADALAYYAERRTMNNPKGWAHVSRVVESAISRGLYAAVPGTAKDHARAVLATLVAAEEATRA